MIGLGTFIWIKGSITPWEGTLGLYKEKQVEHSFVLFSHVDVMCLATSAAMTSP